MIFTLTGQSEHFSDYIIELLETSFQPYSISVDSQLYGDMVMYTCSVDTDMENFFACIFDWCINAGFKIDDLFRLYNRSCMPNSYFIRRITYGEIKLADWLTMEINRTKIHKIPLTIRINNRPHNTIARYHVYEKNTTSDGNIVSISSSYDCKNCYRVIDGLFSSGSLFHIIMKNSLTKLMTYDEKREYISKIIRFVDTTFNNIKGLVFDEVNTDAIFERVKIYITVVPDPEMMD